jgi:hypothetical protein
MRVLGKGKLRACFIETTRSELCLDRWTGPVNSGSPGEQMQLSRPSSLAALQASRIGIEDPDVLPRLLVPTSVVVESRAAPGEEHNSRL